METSSFFIDGRCLFGCYPTNEGLIELVDNNVVVFVDLTTENERVRLNTYETDKEYISYPIKDRYIPINLKSFTKFIINICERINNLEGDEKMYIHCKGGHGRSGIVVASILSYMNKISGEESIILTTKFHNERKVMRDKWRTIGSPQTNKQKEFIIRMFKPVFITNVNIHNTYYILNNNALYTFKHDDVTYKNINRCYYTLKNSDMKSKISKCNTLHEFRKIIESSHEDTFVGNKISFFTNVLTTKSSNPDVMTILMRTFLRPINYIEDNIDLGCIWDRIRHDHYLEIKDGTI